MGNLSVSTWAICQNSPSTRRSGLGYRTGLIFSSKSVSENRTRSSCHPLPEDRVFVFVLTRAWNTPRLTDIYQLLHCELNATQGQFYFSEPVCFCPGNSPKFTQPLPKRGRVKMWSVLSGESISVDRARLNNSPPEDRRLVTLWQMVELLSFLVLSWAWDRLRLTSIYHLPADYVRYKLKFTVGHPSVSTRTTGQNLSSPR